MYIYNRLHTDQSRIVDCIAASAVVIALPVSVYHRILLLLSTDSILARLVERRLGLQVCHIGDPPTTYRPISPNISCTLKFLATENIPQIIVELRIVDYFRQRISADPRRIARKFAHKFDVRYLGCRPISKIFLSHR